MTIPEDLIVKVIFAAAGARAQVSNSSTQSSMAIITIDIPKYQVDMLAKNGATLVYQRDNSYSPNAMMFSNRKYRGNINDGSSKNKLNWQINPTYLLNNLSSCND